MNPLFPRFGGKSRMVKKLIPMMPEHDTYVEPFAGGASVFFGKPKSKHNVLNDRDPYIVETLKQGKKMRSCQRMPPSRSAFERLKRKKRKTLCDKLYVARHSFNGLGISYRPGSIVSKKPDKYRDQLKGVQVTNSDYKTVMKRYNRKGTFFFIDPPYHIPAAKEYYSKTRSEHPHPREVCECARKSKGKVMITYNDHPEVRRACRGLNMKKINVPYSRGTAGAYGKTGKELIITNYDVRGRRR